MVIMAPVRKSKPKLSVKEKKRNDFKMNELNGVANEGDEVPEDIQIIAQEIKIVKSLACNDLTQRNRQMKKLRKWLNIRTKSSFSFTQEDFMRIWKGLYYHMWYSDKPLVQEELADQLGSLFECFCGNLQYCVDFFGAFLKVLCIEWFGIDQWRIDKFMMLTRRMLRYMFKVLKSSGWSLDAIELFNKHATETVLFENVEAKGLTMHYFDIFFEELAKVSEGKISSQQIGMFVQPFVKFIATQKDFNLISHCRTRIFCHLLYQSGLGREYTEKYNAWKAMGFPTKHIDDLEKTEDSESVDFEGEMGDENSGRKELDPRAGNVDVFMPELPLDAKPIIIQIEHFLYKEECSTKRRKLLKKLLDLFKRYQSGEFPLGVKRMPRFENKSEKPLIKEKIRELNDLENELYGVDRKLKQMTKRKRRKFLKSLNFDDIDESNYEQTIEKALPKNYLNERRKRSHKLFMSSWLEEELNDEDLQSKKMRIEPTVNKSEKSSQAKENLLESPNSENQELFGQSKQTNKRTVSNRKAKNVTTVARVNKTLSKKTGINEDENKLLNNHTTVLQISDLQEQLQNDINRRELKVLKISDAEETPPLKIKKKTGASEWDAPLADGEVEYFLPSRKLQAKKATADLVVNPLATKSLKNNHATPISKLKSFSASNSPKTPSSIKRVKIALKNNTSQNPIEYIQKIKSSPNIPYDAQRKPGKGLLKPNAMPSPINPFYKKKIGLKFLNDTI